MLLESEVALKTGESGRTIRRRGFQLAQATFHEIECDLPQIIDWDEHYRVRTPRSYRPSETTRALVR